MQNMTRRLLIAWLSDGCQSKSPCATAGFSASSTVEPSASALDWGAIKYCDLESVGAIADVHQEVKSLCAKDQSASCAEVSDIVFGRRDHALFVSMWACAFREAQHSGKSASRKARSPDELQNILRFLASDSSLQLVEAFRVRHGVAPCIQVLLGLPEAQAQLDAQ